MKTLLRKSVSRMIFPFSYFDNLLRPGVRILMYHRVKDSVQYDQLTVKPEIFDLQMNYLSRKYNVVSLDEALISLFSDRLNSNDVVITFDDGYLDNLENAIPILEKYNFPATIYITTDFCEQVKVHPRYKDEKNRLHLDWDEVVALNEMKGITIGSHTVTHPYLTRLNKNDSEKEIKNSKEIIEKKLNNQVKHFCYPSGDYGERELNFMKLSGYESAVTVGPGKNRVSISPFEIHRTEITERDAEVDLYLKLNGAFDLMHQALHIKRMKEFKKMSVTNF